MRLLVFLCACLGLATSVAAEATLVRVTATTATEARERSSRIDDMLREGTLRPSRGAEDTLLPGRRHQRFQQFHRGVRVEGGDLVRQIDERGEVVSVFGRYHEGMDIDVAPALSPEQARAAVQARVGGEGAILAPPELRVLPLDRGGYALAFSLVASRRGDVRRYYVDARDGRVIADRSLVRRQTPAVGLGTGVLNNPQKMSTAAVGSRFVAIDLLRPAQIITYDLRGDIFRYFQINDQGLPPTAADLALDSDNTWTDGSTVDAHAYAGWMYDYFFKRFGRRGWDDANLAIPQFVNATRPEDIFLYYEVAPELFANAFYCCFPGNSKMVYGVGAPAGTLTSAAIKPFAGALDLVGHELTHGMTDYSSALDNRFCEAGGLNEAFSDMMAVSADFFHRPRSANYRLFEDVYPNGARDMANPGLFGEPDHLSIAEICEEHYLAGIPNQAFYLAIEGGRNRTSGLSVQGVGGANREQIEKVFYRAFTFMLFPDAGYFDAAVATILSARQLYGQGSAADRAVIEAWVAVGVL